MGPKGDPAFINKVGDFIRSIMADTLVKQDILNKLKIPVHYLTSAFIAVIISFLNEWLRSGMKETPYELAYILTFIIRDFPNKVLDLK
jgi:hypothetical protein